MVFLPKKMSLCDDPSSKILSHFHSVHFQFWSLKVEHLRKKRKKKEFQALKMLVMFQKPHLLYYVWNGKIHQWPRRRRRQSGCHALRRSEDFQFYFSKIFSHFFHKKNIFVNFPPWKSYQKVSLMQKSTDLQSQEAW